MARDDWFYEIVILPPTKTLVFPNKIIRKSNSHTGKCRACYLNCPKNNQQWPEKVRLLKTNFIYIYIKKTRYTKHSVPWTLTSVFVYQLQIKTNIFWFFIIFIPSAFGAPGINMIKNQTMFVFICNWYTKTFRNLSIVTVLTSVFITQRKCIKKTLQTWKNTSQ